MELSNINHCMTHKRQKIGRYNKNIFARFFLSITSLKLWLILFSRTNIIWDIDFWHSFLYKIWCRTLIEKNGRPCLFCCRLLRRICSFLHVVYENLRTIGWALWCRIFQIEFSKRFKLLRWKLSLFGVFYDVAMDK